MTVVRTVATHELVAVAFPRSVTERDELGMAIGKAIDTALGRYSNEASRGGRPGVAAMIELGRREFEEQCREADLHPSEAERIGLERELSGVIRAFRGSVLYGLERPRSRMILIAEAVGVYAQPDYWDRASSFYEMKSFGAIPPPPDVALQVAMFQLAFPGLRSFLIGFNRHTVPVDVKLLEVPTPSESDRARTLRSAYNYGLQNGKEKVLEYVDVPVVRYALPPPLVADPPPDRGSTE